MRTKFFFFTFFVFSISTLKIFAQDSIIEKQIDHFNNDIIKILYSQYGNKLMNITLDSFNFRVVPRFYYHLNNNGEGRLELNSSKWELFGVSKDKLDSIWFNNGTIGISRTKWIKTPIEFKLYSKTKYCFYVYCVKDESSFSNLIGYVLNGKMHFISYKNESFDNIDDAIQYFWGSLEKIQEIQRRDESEEEFCVKASITEAKEVLSRSYTEYYRLFPTDTSFLLDKYLNELEYKIKLYKGQKEFLKKLLIRILSYEKTDNILNPEYDYFMDRIVSFELLSTLTLDQYFDLKKNTFEYVRKVNLSKKVLLNFYTNILKKPENEFDEFLREEVFKR